MGSIMFSVKVSPLSSRSGVSFFEVLFALVVVLTVVGTTLATWSKANNLVTRNQAEAAATTLLQQKLDEVGADALATVAEVREEVGRQTVTVSRLGELPYTWKRTVRRVVAPAPAVSVHCVVEWMHETRASRVEGTRAIEAPRSGVQVAAR